MENITIRECSSMKSWSRTDGGLRRKGARSVCTTGSLNDRCLGKSCGGGKAYDRKCSFRDEAQPCRVPPNYGDILMPRQEPGDLSVIFGDHISPGGRGRLQSETSTLLS